MNNNRCTRMLSDNCFRRLGAYQGVNQNLRLSLGSYDNILKSRELKFFIQTFQAVRWWPLLIFFWSSSLFDFYFYEFDKKWLLVSIVFFNSEQFSL